MLHNKEELKIRQPKKGEIVPKVIFDGKASRSFNVNLTIVGIEWGSPKDNKYAYIKRSIFPVENGRKAATKADVKKYL
jgi:hypothetical protein